MSCSHCCWWVTHMLVSNDTLLPEVNMTICKKVSGSWLLQSRLPRILTRACWLATKCANHITETHCTAHTEMQIFWIYGLGAVLHHEKLCQEQYRVRFRHWPEGGNKPLNEKNMQHCGNATKSELTVVVSAQHSRIQVNSDTFHICIASVVFFNFKWKQVSLSKNIQTMCMVSVRPSPPIFRDYEMPGLHQECSKPWMWKTQMLGDNCINLCSDWLS